MEAGPQSSYSEPPLDIMLNSCHKWQVGIILIEANYSYILPLHKIMISIPGEHLVDIIVDGKPRGEPIIIKCGDDMARFLLPPTCVVGKKYSFEIGSQGRSRQDVRVDIRGPDGKSLPVQLEDLPNGNVRASTRFKQVCKSSLIYFGTIH